MTISEGSRKDDTGSRSTKRDVWPGAWVASGLWWGLTYAFGWYVRNIAVYNVMYGGLGAVIALLGWIYLIALTACIGCAFTAARIRFRA